nr:MULTISPECIES: DUF2057 family protein [unclassified Marinobacter]
MGSNLIGPSRVRRPSRKCRSSPASAENALEQLKTIWETASDEEKKAFLRWAFE